MEKQLVRVSIVEPNATKEAFALKSDVEKIKKARDTGNNPGVLKGLQESIPLLKAAAPKLKSPKLKEVDTFATIANEQVLDNYVHGRIKNISSVVDTLTAIDNDLLTEALA